MSGITETFEIKAPEGALVFLSEQEYEGYKKSLFQHGFKSKVVGAPQQYPCIGFVAFIEPIEGVTHKVMAFVYLHASEWKKLELLQKCQNEALDRFECVLLTSE